jgi:hypothetical protein
MLPLHTAVHAREQRLAQQFDTLRRAVVQQAEALREEVPRGVRPQARGALMASPSKVLIFCSNFDPPCRRWRFF